LNSLNSTEKFARLTLSLSLLYNRISSPLSTPFQIYRKILIENGSYKDSNSFQGSYNFRQNSTTTLRDLLFKKISEIFKDILLTSLTFKLRRLSVYSALLTIFLCLSRLSSTNLCQENDPLVLFYLLFRRFIVKLLRMVSKNSHSIPYFSGFLDFYYSVSVAAISIFCIILFSVHSPKFTPDCLYTRTNS
jgi:hypothetical protein